jgi:UDP:flavonoid glycosyltransferase YjiC (YdhE family)
MRFLILPSSNSLSHSAKGAAIQASLTTRGHQVVMAASRRNASFLAGLGLEHELLPDIPDADSSANPTIRWFQPQRFAECVQAEAALIRRVRPDRVLGVFRFTGRVSTRLCGVPYASLTCGCMTPQFQDVLGFSASDPGRRQQEEHMSLFRRSCARRVNQALARLGAAAVDDPWQLLLGDRTFLWDFPEFLSIPPAGGVSHTGPIWWSGWPRNGFDARKARALRPPVALVAFGTAGIPAEALARPVQALLELGWSVIAAGGGQSDLGGLPADHQRLLCCDFVPTEEVLAKVQLLLCHGGQGLVFEALRQAVPILVVPFQPEQSHNGLCLERAGWGRRLFPARPYQGQPVHLEDLRSLDRRTLQAALRALVEDPAGSSRLRAAAQVLRRYEGTAAVTRSLEGPW